MINRTLNEKITSKIGRGKAIVIVGSRQVGKTTLIKKHLEGLDYQFFDGDDPVVRKFLDNANTEEIRRLIGNRNIVFIDEGQRIQGIGITLKIIVDQMPDVQLWVSGSSSFALFQELSEPLTGRKWEYELFPISWEEFENHLGYLKAEQQLETRLIYGFYPDVINNPGDEIEILNNLVNSYLYRDVLSYATIRKPKILEDLVQALALQIGNEVNYNELSQLLGVDKNTIKNYIDILEKGYVIFRLNSYSKNLRNEIKKGMKIYFYDTGVRNTIIGNYNDLDLRVDKGSLWENFLIAERIKQNHYKSTFAKSYFWRTTQQQELDYLEEKNQNLHGYEFKWKVKRQVRIPKTFLNYNNATGHVITRANFRDFAIIQ